MRSAAAPSVDQLRAIPWVMDTRIDGERVADIIERTPRFRFEGSGRLADRTIVPETQAAKDALAGANGVRLERALRGWLATWDAQAAVTSLESVGFSVDGRTSAINHVIGQLSWADAPVGFAPAPGADSNGPERKAWKAAVEAVAGQLEEADQNGGAWGVSYRSINLSPLTTRTFFDAVAGTTSPYPDNEDNQLHILVHELAHRITEPNLADPDLRELEHPTPEQAAKMSRMQLLSEGSADLITNLPGIKHEARGRMGLPPVPEAELRSGYAMFVDALTRVLRQAGLDSRSPEHRDPIVELLERGEMETVPDAAASLIVQRQGIPWRHHHVVAEAIRDIGSHGMFPTDGDTAERVAAELDARTARAEDLIGMLAQQARTRRERGSA